MSSPSGKEALACLNQEIDSHALKKNYTQKTAFHQYIKQTIQHLYDAANVAFWENKPIEEVIQTRAQIVDYIIKLCWSWYGLEQYSSLAIIASGGYGELHLHPHSDIDTFILLEHHDDSDLNHQLESLISFLWDMGFNFATNVLTQDELLQLAKSDLSVFTSLLSVRLIEGSPQHFEYVYNLPNAFPDLWPFEDFFAAKVKERQDRHQRFKNTEYNQEPNIKESPGALRDIDFIDWLAKRRYGPHGIVGLCESHNFSSYEFDLLRRNKKAFWEIRYALHLLSKKPSDRLFLEYQTDIAKTLSWPGETLNESVSMMMQQYFCMASQIREISDILAQRFTEQLTHVQHESVHTLSPHCQLVGQFIEITQPEWYFNKPEEFIALFLTHANTYAVEGFTAQTNQTLYIYFNNKKNGFFLENTTAKKYFIECFNYPHKVGSTLNLMNRLGVLSHFIPDFSKLIGQMQYDLNHVYTVDAHTLLVIQFVQSFYQAAKDNHIPFVKECLNICTDPLILYCAAFFHDIGKGRGGDHSQIGEQIALAFCQKFDLSEKQTKLITWLVLHHLALSHFAQSKDLSDPLVILEFSEFVETQEKLCYLYLLTAADIQGTNPKLWNSWRQALLGDLFEKTLAILTHSSPPEAEALSQISSKKTAVLQELQDEGLSEDQVNAFWSHMKNEYFEMTSIKSLKWHAMQVINQKEQNQIIAIRPHWNKAGTDILVYSPDRTGLFAMICRVLEKLMLTIAEAKIATSTHGFCLNALVVLESSGQPISGPQRLMEIKKSLFNLLKSMDKSKSKKDIPLPYLSRHVPRWYKYYQVKSKVDIYTHDKKQQTVIEVHAPDFPGLLARMGRVLARHRLAIHSARINTLGDKVVDFFYVTSKSDHKPLLEEEQISSLKQDIKNALR